MVESYVTSGSVDISVLKYRFTDHELGKEMGHNSDNPALTFSKMRVNEHIKA